MPRLRPFRRRRQSPGHIQHHVPDRTAGGDLPGSLSRPIGGGGSGTPLPPGGLFGPNPPTTTAHWLNGVGQMLTPTPAMIAVAVDFHKLGYYAQRQAAQNWHRISKIKSTV